MYGTEKYVGQAIKDSGIARSEIFLNSKIYNTCYAPELVPQGLVLDLSINYFDSNNSINPKSVGKIIGIVTD